MLNAEEFNSMFGEALTRGGESLEKVAEVTGLYIQDKLRENSFAKKILPPQTVTVAELTRNTSDEGLEYIDDLEPDSIAMRVNMRGEPEKTYIQGKRYAIRLGTITSDRFQKSEQELRSYRMPLTKIIEQNTVKDIQEQVDKTFMQHVRVGLMMASTVRMNELVARGNVNRDAGTTPSLGTLNFHSSAQLASYLFTRHVDIVANGGALDALNGLVLDTTPGNSLVDQGTAFANYNPAPALFTNILVSEELTFTRTVLRDLIKVAPAREMKGRVFLLSEYDWTDTVGWLDSEAGLEITKEIVVGGYKYSTVGGYTFVTTVRDNPDILQPGQIYAFPAPEFLGRHLVLENTKFYINKEGRFFHMEAWEDCGIGFGNIKGLAMILLAGASVSLPSYFLDDAGSGLTDLGVATASGETSGEFSFVNDPTSPI